MLFDYFKEAFRINRSNKELYGPQIGLILIRMAAIAGIGVWLYIWLGDSRVRNFMLLGVEPWDVILLILKTIGFGFLGLILWLLIVRMVEAGLFNMYKVAVQTGSVPSGTFGAGIGKFFLPFVLGDLLIALCFLVVSPVLLILGLATLFIGFILISTFAGILLMFWKVSLVWNRRGIVEAIRDSFRFAWRNFAGVTALFLIRRAFTAPMVGGNPTVTYNFSSQPNLDQLPFSINPINLLDALRFGVAIVTAILVIVIAVSMLIKVVFDVFFGLSLFVAYKHGFQPEGRVSDVV